jgi:hypothetical protein
MVAGTHAAVIGGNETGVPEEIDVLVPDSQLIPVVIRDDVAHVVLGHIRLSGIGLLKLIESTG